MFKKLNYSYWLIRSDGIVTKYRAFLLEPPTPLAVVQADKITNISDDFHHPVSGYDDPVHPAGSAVGMGAPYPQRA